MAPDRSSTNQGGADAGATSGPHNRPAGDVRQTVRALRDRDELLTLAERSAGIGIWEIDLATDTVRGTAQYYRTMGMEPTDESTPMQQVRALRHPEERRRVSERFQRLLHGQDDTFEVDYRILRPDGKTRWIFGRGRVIRDAAGRAIHYSGVDVDITERKRAEAALRESEARLRELNEQLETQVQERARQLASSQAQLQTFFHNSPDWLTLIRALPDGRFVYADLNPTCELAYGLTREQVIGRDLHLVLGDEAAQVPLRHLRECVRSGEPQRYIARRSMAGRTHTIDVMFVLVPGTSDTGEKLIITTARDITEHEAIESQLRQAQKMEALGQLTGGVAHDFNNLLAVIMGSAELAKKRGGADMAHLMDNVLRAGERGVALTRQLLAFSRRQVANPRVIDLPVELPRIMQMLRASLRGDIELRTSIPDDAWFIEADPDELEIALLNVAANARDAMPNGGCFQIEVRNVAAGGEIANDRVAITIRDTGVGIPPALLTKVFDPFFTTKEVGAGTGLGLSQVYGFAQQSGGSVGIESELERGTALTLYLPRSSKMVGTDPRAILDPEAEQGRGRILLVEDNADVAQVTAQVLCSMGFTVDTVERAQTALERLAVCDFDLMLTDVVMPDGMNGLELAQAVRARWPQLPIVLMSGYSGLTPADVASFQMLRKPVAYQELRKAVLAHLRVAGADDKAKV